MRGFCFLAGLCTFTTIVTCSSSQHDFADYNTHLSNPLHEVVSLGQLGRTNLLTTVRDGYTGDPCEFNLDCKGTRFCYTGDSSSLDFELCIGRSGCLCVPIGFELLFCTDPEKCETGEICAADGDRAFPRCVSQDFARRNGLSIVTSPRGEGYTGEECSDSSDCKPERECRYAPRPSEICDNRDPCMCIPLSSGSCCVDTDCVSEEICVVNLNIEEDERIPFCVSPLGAARTSNKWVSSNCTTPSPLPPSPSPSPPPSTTPSPSPVSSSSPASPSSSPPTPLPSQSDPPFVPDSTPMPCIAVHQVEHLSESELVFPKHVWSKVLCDAQMSCASPGHIVVYKGKTLMMSSYCEIVGCTGRVMQVNSPRYLRKHRIPSMTEGLEFTVFSARYETTLEQYVMAFVVKMGL